MPAIDFDEIVSLVVDGWPPKRLSLADAVREVIAIPQKQATSPTIMRRRRRPLTRYGQVVALYTRPDFPDP